MGFNYTADESFQMGMNSRERKLDEIERRLAVVEKKLASDVRENERGEWLYEQLIPNTIEGKMYGECSRCHKVRIIDNFCPNCGADMRKGEKNELPELRK